MWGNIAISFLLSFIISFMLVPGTILLAKKIGAIDIPKDNRRMHKDKVPRLGGIAVIISFLITSVFFFITMNMENTINFGESYDEYSKLVGIFFGIITVSIMGIVDDISPLRPHEKLIIQILSAIIVISFGLKINEISIPLFQKIGLNKEVSIIITIVWIVGVTNAINLIDGLDGLSSGISIIALISLVIIFIINNVSAIPIILSSSLIGAIVGFLPYNYFPARTFLGDTGSNFLGFMLSTISILGFAKTYVAIIAILPIFILGLPIFDVAFTIIRRIIKGKSIKAVFYADNGHIHHRLIKSGFSQKEAVLILYSISGILGLFSIIILDSGIAKAIAFILMTIAGSMLGISNYTNFMHEKKYTNDIKM